MDWIRLSELEWSESSRAVYMLIVRIGESVGL